MQIKILSRDCANDIISVRNVCVDSVTPKEKQISDLEARTLTLESRLALLVTELQVAKEEYNLSAPPPESRESQRRQWESLKLQHDSVRQAKASELHKLLERGRSGKLSDDERKALEIRPGDDQWIIEAKTLICEIIRGSYGTERSLRRYELIKSGALTPMGATSFNEAHWQSWRNEKLAVQNVRINLFCEVDRFLHSTVAEFAAANSPLRTTQNKTDAETRNTLDEAKAVQGELSMARQELRKLKEMVQAIPGFVLYLTEMLAVIKQNENLPLALSSSKIIDVTTMSAKLVWKTDVTKYNDKWIFQNCLYQVSGVSGSLEERALLIYDFLEKRRRKLARLQHQVSADVSATDNQRQRIPDEVRHEVWRRDEGKCSRCGSRTNIEYDHIVPVSLGGSNTARNIELLCEACNRSKGARIA